MFGLVSCVIYLAASRVEGAGFGAGVDVVVGGHNARVGVVVGVVGVVIVVDGPRDSSIPYCRARALGDGSARAFGLEGSVLDAELCPFRRAQRGVRVHSFSQVSCSDRRELDTLSVGVGVVFGGVIFVRSERDYNAVDVVVIDGRRHRLQREVAGVRGGGRGGVTPELRWRLRR
jgi:hypothetical protein